MDLPNRRTHVTQEIANHGLKGSISVTVGLDEMGRPVEVFFSQRSQPGSGLDELLYQLGVTASKIMQGEAYE